MRSYFSTWQIWVRAREDLKLMCVARNLSDAEGRMCTCAVRDSVQVLRRDKDVDKISFKFSRHDPTALRCSHYFNFCGNCHPIRRGGWQIILGPHSYLL